MSVLREQLLELLWPTRCIICDVPDTVLCEECWEELPFIDQKQACPRCGAPFGVVLCTCCQGAVSAEREWDAMRISSSPRSSHRKGEELPPPFFFTTAVSALEFSDMSVKLVIGYKDGGERRLAAVLARLLCQCIPRSWFSWADTLVYIPADASAVRRRGFDHMEAVAHELSQLAGIRCASPLVKCESSDQRSLGRRLRMENMQQVFELAGVMEEGHSPVVRMWRSGGVARDGTAAIAFQNIRFAQQLPLIKPEGPGVSEAADALGAPEVRVANTSYENILLIDDVFTTGATLDAASKVLLDGGVREVRVATVVRVW